MKIVFAGVAILLIANVSGVGVEDRRLVEEATARMERLAAKLEHTKKLVPETVAAISELIHRYDCEQHSCDTVLEKRNHAALIRLKRALHLDEHTRAFDLAISLALADIPIQPSSVRRG
jgi:hypothetical protein